MQCEPLKKWFADNVCPEIWDPALVEKAAPAVPNSQGSGSDGLTVGGTVITDSSVSGCLFSWGATLLDMSLAPA